MSNDEIIADLESYCEWCLAQGGHCLAKLDGCSIFDLIAKLKAEALALLAKPECKTCGGLKVVCKDDIGLAFGGVAASCPRCKGTGIEPEPEPSEFTKHLREQIAYVTEMIKGEHLEEELDWSEMLNQIKEAAALLDSQQAEIGRLIGIFNDYGHHLHGCNAEYCNAYACTCGFNQALSEDK